MAFSSILNLWNKWNIRSFIILSLSLQVFLVLFASLRKKSANHLVFFLLWLAYLMADWVGAFAIGLISHNQGKSCTYATDVDGALLGFWSSFLLLHLGGPDTITAFSLEDSSLSQRHLLSFICQVSAAIYVFAQIFPYDKSLVIPTMLVFLAAITKNVERLLALYLSSLSSFKASVVSQINPFRVEDVEYFEKNVLGDIYYDEEEPKLLESIVVKHAYYFFQIFKVFLGDLIFTSKERDMSRQYFHKFSAMDALRVMSVELNFIYEVLHTKVLVIRSKLSYFCRFIAFTHIVIAFFLFNRSNKHRLSQLDVEITYILLFGGIVLDMIALFMLIFSDWTIAGIQHNYRVSSQQNYFLFLVSATDKLRKPQFATYKVESNAVVTYTALKTPLIFRRWSESIFAYNLLSEFLKKNLSKQSKFKLYGRIIAFCILPNRMAVKTVSCFRKASKIARLKYKPENPLMNKLWIFIFDEVRRKSMHANNPLRVKEIFDARGDLFLKNSGERLDCGHLLEFITEVNYDFSILTWHVASEIWYNREEPPAKNDEREFSKILSDYMFYLLIYQPDVMSAVVGFAQMAAMTAAKTLVEMWMEVRAFPDLKMLCEEMYEMPLENDSKSVLSMGIKLAKSMESLGNKKWEVMSGVWVEMLSYAATHIKGVQHVKVLSKGGELLTFVWLLMAHSGCFYKQGWGISYERYHLYKFR